MYNLELRRKFLDRCKTYHRKEERDFHFAEAFKKFKNDKVEGIAYLLEKWNPRVTKIRAEIQNALKESESILGRLSKTTLLDLNPENAGEVKKIFGIFKQKVKTTGASKTLHLLNQELFVMWDRRIRDEYHRILKATHSGHGKKKEEDCYFQFLLDCKEFSNTLLKGEDPQQLIDEHMKNLKDINRTWKCYERCEYRETLAKMIDEFNYVTLGLRFVKKPWEV